MNKKGQSFPLAILSALAVLIVGLMFVNFLMPEINTFRVDMNCASPNNIHDGNKITCLIGDATIPYFIISIFSIITGVVVARMTAWKDVKFVKNH